MTAGTEQGPKAHLQAPPTGSETLSPRQWPHQVSRGIRKRKLGAKGQIDSTDKKFQRRQTDLGVISQELSLVWGAGGKLLGLAKLWF